MGDRPGHEFRGNQWTVGGGGVRVDPTRQDKLSLEEARSEMRGLVKKFREDPEYAGAATVVAKYAEATQNEGLATREIVKLALKGKTEEQILANPKVQKLIANINQYRNADYQEDPAKLVKSLAESAPGYYATVRGAEPTPDVVYRGAGRKVPAAGEEFELQGPTAFTHSRDVALTYATGTMFEVVPGAKMLPVHEMLTAKNAAEEGGDTEKYANVPSFYSRSDKSIDPRGPGYGYARDFDSDRELSTAGRFKVLEVIDRRLPFHDQKSGKEKFKTVKVVRVQHVGVY